MIYQQNEGPAARIDMSLVSGFIDWQRDQRGRSATTIHDYTHRLASLLDYLDAPLAEVELQCLEAWTQRKRNGRQAKPSTQAKDVAVVRSLYDYLEGHGLIGRNPARALHGPVVHNVQPRPVSEDAWAAVWAARLPDEARVVLGLGFYVGLRRQEIAQLQVRHVSPLAQTLVGFPRKGGGQGALPYGEMLGVWADYLPHLIPGGAASFLDPLHALVRARAGCRYLLGWGEHQSPVARKRRTHGLVDPVANDPDWVNRAMRKWLRHLGLDQYAMTPHMLRHSTATYLLRAGLPIEIVAELLNHSNIQVTRRYARLGAPAITAWRQRTQRSPRLSEGF